MSNCAVFFNTMRTEQKTSVKNSIGRLVFVGISVLLQVIWIINLFLWLNRYSAAISLFSTLIAVSVVFAIYGTHGNMAFKVPWMLLIAAFPIFGLCVFLLFGRSNLTRSMKKRYELIDEELFPFLNGDDEVIKELQEKDLSIANQSDYIWKYGHYPVYHNTDVAFYADASQGLEAQLAELKKACENFELETKRGNANQVAQADVELHDIILKASGNERLMQMISKLSQQMYRYRLEYIKDADKRQILMVEHEHILKALTLRHIQEAKMAVREHIDNQEITILKNLKEQENDIQRKVPGRRN